MMIIMASNGELSLHYEVQQEQFEPRRKGKMDGKGDDVILGWEDSALDHTPCCIFLTTQLAIEMADWLGLAMSKGKRSLTLEF